ncbi:MAG: isoprenyl transferase [Planctomycetes bacterium]|nr:isoprenyl transferase [Planctomycetota bacterium]
MKKSFKEKRKETAKRLGIKPEQIPHHIAIIMDGNGRWAKKKAMPRVVGHRQGAKILEEISVYCVDLGIEYLTLYSFSTENWKRPKAEIKALMYIHTRYLIGIRNTLMKCNVKLVHLGQSAQLPEKLKTALAETMKLTAGNDGMTLALALNYGGRDEIINATKKIAQEYKNGKLRLKNIDENCFAQHLYTADMIEPDFLIRTANEMRISNFLLWQTSYAEFYVTKTLWPDFNKTSVDKAILVYAKRTRHFGTVRKTKK